MDINSDLDTGIQSASLSADIKAATGRVTALAERAATFQALVECYRVLSEEPREVALAYIRRRIKEESTK